MMENENVFVIGDIHGDFRPVRELQLRINTKIKGFFDQVNYLICLGDFGANFFLDGQRDTEFKTKLGRYHFQYFVIRGNHEERPSVLCEKNPDAWHIEDHFGNLVYVENEFPYIWYALDAPATYNINGYRTLCLGGAYSVDKYLRLKQGWSWFEGEQMSDVEMDCARYLVEQNKNYDIVLSHTCPICYEPTDLFLSVVDQSMVDKTMERFLGEIEYKVDYKLWLFGHFHRFREYPVADSGSRVIMLFNDYAIALNDTMNKPKEESVIKL